MEKLSGAEPEPKLSRTKRILQWAGEHPFKAAAIVGTAIFLPVGIGIVALASPVVAAGITVDLLARGAVLGVALDAVFLGVTKALMTDFEPGPKIRRDIL